ncbi:MAG: amidohydrolase [Oscillospiraceae bacterium]|nr:amidohydrolase [Oscillospiraceae bacterium]
MINRDSGLAREFWESRAPGDCYILDFHAHMHNLASMYLPAFSPELMIEVMQRCNTKLTVFCSHMAMAYAEFEEGYNLNVAKRFPGHFLAYHAVIPGRTDFKAAIARLEANKAYYLGMKMHADTDQTPLTSDAYKPFMEYLDANRLPALLHTWGGSKYDGVDEVATIATRYPGAIFICGHSFHDDWKNGAELIKNHPNLIAELTAVMDNRGAIELLCAEVGSERILFGTDVPWFDTHHGVGAVLSADITDDDRRNIFYRNGEKLLKQLHKDNIYVNRA